ncbi:glycosyltransferase [Rhodococcoides corynebacterioides]|uniref:glycosyltransferase n=1 Tax=Rhodococcoides corynebacterioides TaxID=53972 RepID=UPI003F80303A
MDPLSTARLIYVAPAAGLSGVGDYADDLVATFAPHFASVTDYRIETEGAESVRDIVRHRRRVRDLVHAEARPTVVHFEQSSGSLSTFWASAVDLGQSAIVTATVHDPPHPVWWPFKTRGVARNRALHHAVHYPARALHTALQRRVMKGRTVFALTDTGARSIELPYPSTRTVAARIFVPERPTPPALSERPTAVGLFGHVYGGKGFDLVADLRRAIDPDIDIVVAGRGTVSLPAVPGVRVLGEVNGADEDAFFASIRFLVVPYRKHGAYGPSYPASSTITRAFAYRTPVVCFTEGSLAETVRRGGAIGGDTVEELGAVVNAAVHDTDRLRELADAVDSVSREDALSRCAITFLDTWRSLLTHRAGLETARS